MRGRVSFSLSILVFLFLTACVQGHAENYALLVGIGNYGMDGGAHNLDGPPHDVAAIRTFCCSRYKPGNVIALVDGEATRARILSALDTIADKVRPGDFFFFYYSGHGAGAKQFGFDAYTGAIVPADFRQGTPAEMLERLILGRRDLRPRLERIDQVARGFIVFDSCYSGNAVKGMRPSGKSKYLPLKGEWADADAPPPAESGAADVYPYRHLIFLSAATGMQTADDIDAETIRQHLRTTFDGQPHGALTDAMVSGLKGGVATYEEMAVYLQERSRLQNWQHTPCMFPEGFVAGLSDQPVWDTKGVVVGNVKPPRIFGPVLLRVENVDAPVRQAIASIPGVKVSDGEYDFWLRGDGGGLMLFGEGGAPLRAEPFTLEEIKSRLASEPNLRRLLHSTGAGGFPLHLEIKPARQGIYFLREPIEIEVAPAKDCYILALDMDVTGEITVLYPQQGSAEHITAGHPIPLQAGQVTPPLGVEYIGVYAFAAKPHGYDEWARVKDPFPAAGAEGTEMLRTIEAQSGAVARESLRLITQSR